MKTIILSTLMSAMTAVTPPAIAQTSPEAVQDFRAIQCEWIGLMASDIIDMRDDGESYAEVKRYVLRNAEDESMRRYYPKLLANLWGADAHDAGAVYTDLKTGCLMGM